MPKTAPFEQHSDAYDAWFQKNSTLYTAELATIRQLIPAAEAQGLEVGVGSGKFAAPLGIKIGVEPSQKMADKARALGINVYPGVAEALPFPDDSFDFVLMVTTICFFDDPQKALKEAFRVLNSDGCIVVGFIDKESTLGRQYAAKREGNRFYQDANFLSTQEVQQYLRDAGFVVEKIRQTLIPGASPETILDNFGSGAFVAIKGIK
ncbi:MAG: methyltransferase domain-containing protein [Anaerolineales bacterium]|nr:methyltransferase domain-containing protein [Anaerolineales bacterium]